MVEKKDAKVLDGGETKSELVEKINKAFGHKDVSEDAGIELTATRLDELEAKMLELEERIGLVSAGKKK